MMAIARLRIDADCRLIHQHQFELMETGLCFSISVFPSIVQRMLELILEPASILTQSL
jgi:hypothetical protein